MAVKMSGNFANLVKGIKGKSESHKKNPLVTLLLQVERQRSITFFIGCVGFENYGPN